MIDVKGMSDEYLLDTDKKYDKIYSDVLAKRESPKFIERTQGNPPPINPIFLQIRDEIKGEITRRNQKVSA